MPSTSVTLSTTWTRYSVTLPMPTIQGATFGTDGTDYTGIEFWLSSGATNNAVAGLIGVQTVTAQLWGMQAEIASGAMPPVPASPLEKPEPAQLWERCQRHYMTIPSMLLSGNSGAGATIYDDFNLPVQMRALPTAALTGITYSNASALAVNGATKLSHIKTTAIVTAAGACYADFTLTLTADI